MRSFFFLLSLFILLAPQATALAATDVELTDEYREETCAYNTAVCFCDDKSTGITVSTSSSDCLTVCETNSANSWDIYCTSLTCKTESCQGDFHFDGKPISYEPSVAEEPKNDPVVPNLNVSIPGLEFTDPTQDGKYTKVNFLGEYVDAIYRLLMAACAVVAVVMLMIAGLQYTLSRGNASAVKQAKDRIKNAIVGLVLLMSAYSIAFLLDPSTTKFLALSIESVPKEPLPVEYEEDVSAYGATGTIDPADVTTIAGSHLIVNTDDKRIAIDVLASLNSAADSFFTSSASYGNKQNLNIRVTSASRTVATQSRLFYENCIENNGVCSPGTCNPARNSSLFTKSGSTWTMAGTLSNVSTDDSATIIAAMVQNGDPAVCMHTNYVAVDVWPEGQASNYVFDVELQDLLTAVMLKNGFCRIASEPWHFEASSKSTCSGYTATSSSYKTRGVSYTTSACKTWDGLNHCCTVPKDKTSPPGTMCK